MSLNIPLTQALKMLDDAQSLRDIVKLFQVCFPSVRYDKSMLENYNRLSVIAEKLNSGLALTPADCFVIKNVSLETPIFFVDESLEDIKQTCPGFTKEYKTIQDSEITPEKYLMQSGKEWMDSVIKSEDNQKNILKNVEDAWQNRANIFNGYLIYGLKYIKSANNKHFDNDISLSILRKAITDKLPDEFQSMEHIEYLRKLLQSKTDDSFFSTDEGRRFTELCVAARDQELKENDKLTPEFKLEMQKMITADEKVKELSIRLYDQLTNALYEKSEITEDDAKTWAEKNVYVSRQISNGLKKLDYPEEKLKQDIAQFYRLCGGKLGPIKFIGSIKNKRAYAQGRTHIAIDNDFNKRTLFHECGHIAEGWDMRSCKASKQFIENRATKPVRKLKYLVPNSRYANNEVAYPDHFIDPYVGKVTQHQSSEVYSMGMQMFANPETLAWFMQKDPEHFNLIIGQCLHKDTYVKCDIEKTQKDTEESIKKTMQDKAKFKAWEKALSNAMPKDFKEALFKVGVENVDFSQSSRSRAVHVNFKSGAIPYTILPNLTTALNFAYIYFACKNGLLPDSPYGNGKNVNILAIERDLEKSKVPSWFNSGDMLPAYKLPPDIIARLEDIKKQETKTNKLKPNFFQTIDSRTPPELFNILYHYGFKGYVIEYAGSSKYALKKKIEGFCFRRIGIFSKEECTRCAAMLVAYELGQWPETFADEEEMYQKMAAYATGEEIPEWFSEE